MATERNFVDVEYVEYGSVVVRELNATVAILDTTDTPRKVRKGFQNIKHIYLRNLTW